MRSTVRIATSLLILLSIIFGCLPLLAYAQAAQPELPRLFVDTAMPALTGRIIRVNAGGSLQNAFNAANPGDTIELQSTATFTGNFILPLKSGSTWIIVRTSNMAALPVDETRAGPPGAGAMPKIYSPNTQPAIRTASGAHHFRFIGVEIGLTANVATNFGLVLFGNDETSLAQLPHDLIIDRCYIHGNATGDVSRGVALNAASSAVIDSYISNIHGVGFDTQAIAAWNSPGPLKIVNNYLEGAGENCLLGGKDPSIAGLVISDIEFRRNLCSKPISWNPRDPSYAGIHWAVKNLFELKNAQRVLADGNIFENNWRDGQNGAAILFTPRNQDGTAPQSVVQDITFTNNIVRFSGSAINILGTDNEKPSQRTKRIKIDNNLLYGIGRPGDDGAFIILTSGMLDLMVNRNTVLHDGNIITLSVLPKTTGLTYTNNITAPGSYGIFGADAGEGVAALNKFVEVFDVSGNVFIGRASSLYPPGAPANAFPAALADVGFVNVAAHDYRLSPSSPYQGKGVDFAALNAAQSGAVIVPPPPADTTPPAIISAGPVNMSAYGPDVAITTNEPCRVFIEFGLTASYGYQTAASPLAANATISMIIFAPGTNVHYRIVATDAAGNVTKGPDQVFSTTTLLIPVSRNN
jgi:hypothetical protein